jgi:hypothetical protein
VVFATDAKIGVIVGGWGTLSVGILFNSQVAEPPWHVRENIAYKASAASQHSFHLCRQQFAQNACLLSSASSRKRPACGTQKLRIDVCSNNAVHGAGRMFFNAAAHAMQTKQIHSCH